MQFHIDTSFGTMGTLGVALLGVGEALGFPAAMTVGAIVSGAYLGDKMSPVSDSTNITASICETPLFRHIGSMCWTTIPAFVCAGVIYAFLGKTQAQAPLDNLQALMRCSGSLKELPSQKLKIHTENLQ